MTTPNELYIVAIGASAGGLEAIEEFFSQVPRYSGLAYVIIQHLSPDYKSLMPEILAKKNEVPIHTAVDGMLVEPNNIYLIPRNMNMEIIEGKLKLTQRTDRHTFNLPIDIFFSSLAKDLQDKSIAIILSGTGSDGSRGIREIKEAGGMIIVQNPETAKFDGMPRNAILTGVCDFILPPKEMAIKLIAYIQHPFVDKKIHQSVILDEKDYFSRILHLLKVKFELDFSDYKPATIVRRLERRLNINQIETLSDYLELLKNSVSEQRTLYKELLIGVTKFFRDPDAFKHIEEEVIPQIFEQKKSTESVRVWIAGCSTGEEVYSIAILFKEYCKRNEIINDIKIFATDIDKSAIEYASYGTFNASISADISPQLLNRYFEKVGDSFKIASSIRELVVFATHNVFKDPPFNKIDLVVCRNLLIYFKPILQEKTLSLFHFALNKGGYLFLGSSETVGALEDIFERDNAQWKIFRAKGDKRALSNTMLSTSQLKDLHSSVSNVPSYANKRTSLINEQFNLKLLEDNTPDTVIVNSQFELVNSFGEIRQYIHLPVTKVLGEQLNMNIKQMVPPEQRLIFNVALSQSLKSSGKIVYNDVKYQCYDGSSKILDLVFSSLHIASINSQFVFVYFIEKTEKTDTRAQQQNVISGNISEQSTQRIIDLENELSHTKENLQATIEELETTNEELQTTNEELISSNEELQSTNEELQSVNEELYTVNTEFQVKNKELTIANSDLENLFANADSNIIFLDYDLCIRKFTPNITTIIHLKNTDEGRPLSDLNINLKGVDLTKIAIEVLHKQTSITMRVESYLNKWYQMRVVPYLLKSDMVNGIIINFNDITDAYYIEKNLIQARQSLEDIYNGLPVSLFVLDINDDGDCVLTLTNKTHDIKRGYLPKQVYGKKLSELSTYYSKHEIALLEQKIEQCITEKCNITYEDSLTIQETTTCWLRILSPVCNEQGTVTRIIGSSVEISEQKRVEKDLKIANEKLKEKDKELIILHDSLNSSINGVIITDIEGKITYCNPAFIDMFDYEDASDIQGHYAQNLFVSNKVKKFTDLSTIIHKDEAKIGNFEVLCKNGLTLKVLVSSSVIRDKQENKIGMMASFINISQLIEIKS